MSFNVLLAEESFISQVWSVLSSGYALAAYAAILLVLIIILSVSLMSLASKGGAGGGKVIIESSEDAPLLTAAPVAAADSSVKRGSAEDADEDRRRFYSLSNIDAEYKKYQRESYDKGITLKNFCESFRAFSCSELNLYYSIEDIMRFVAGLAVSKLIILQGMSGTGKTSLAFAMGEFLDNYSTVIPVQPMWKERTDLIGYYNEFTKKFNETTLLSKMYEANYSKDIYITVLDEMNIARVEYYFAEFLSLLELPNASRRYLDVVSDHWATDPKQLKKGQIKLPENMWFIGTANNDDSTFAISDKVYDRAMILNLDKKCQPFTCPKTPKTHLAAEDFKMLIKDALEEYSITVRNLKRLEKLDKYMIKHFRITFGNRIMKQIKTYVPVYVACGGAEIDALDDIISKKVLRKLEMQNPIYVKNEAQGFMSFLDELFGENSMPLCREAVERIEKNV